jgi:4-carboxymuconolactone decarboxylase
MDDSERFAAGMKKRRQVLGDAWVERSITRRNDFNGDFLDFLTRSCWGDVWLRPHFDDRTRRIIVISTMIALGRWEEFRLHMRAALVEGKFSQDDIKEIILQQAVYCGVPAANSAMKEAGEVLEEIGKTKV